MADFNFDPKMYTSLELIQIKQAFELLAMANFFEVSTKGIIDSITHIWDRSDPDTLLKAIIQAKEECRFFAYLQEIPTHIAKEKTDASH